MENKLEFKIGILVVIAIIIVVVFIFFVGNFSSDNGINLYVDYTFSGTIREGSSVKISGIEVGTVKKVEFRYGKKNKFGKNILVRLHLFINDKYKDTIRKDALFYITTAGILGELYIEVNPGDFNKEPIEKDSVVMGVAPPKMDLMLTQASQVLEAVSKLLNENGDMLTDLVSELFTLTKNANSLLKDNREKIDSVLTSTEKLLANSVVLTDKANNIIGDGSQIKGIIKNVDRLTLKLDKKITPLLDSVDSTLVSAQGLLVETEGLLTKNKDNISKLLDNSVSLTDKTDKMLDKTDEMITFVSDGKGNVGKFLRTSEIYDSVKELLFTLKRKPWKVMWRGE